MCFDYTPYLSNVGGEQNPFAPPVTANITVDYQFHVGGSSVIDPRLTFSHVDQQYASIFEYQYNQMQARNLLDASIDWTANKWDVQLYSTNLANQLYVISGGSSFYYGAPRQVGLQATYTF